MSILGLKPPTAGGAGIDNFSETLRNLTIPQLLHEFSNPASRLPKYAVLSQIDVKQKQDEAMQKAQGQMAIAQNAQMQVPVAGQVLQKAAMTMAPQPPAAPVAAPTQFAANGGIMHGYARGGEVQRFARGADEDGLQAEDVEPSMSYAEQVANALGLVGKAPFKAAGQLLSELVSAPGHGLDRLRSQEVAPAPGIAAVYPDESRRRGAHGKYAVADVVSTPAPEKKAAGARPDTKTGIAAAAAAGKAPATDNTDLDAAAAQQRAAAIGTGRLSPEQQAAYEAQSKGMMDEYQASGQRADALARLAEARAARLEKMGNQPIWENTSALLKMASKAKGRDWLSGVSEAGSEALDKQQQLLEKADELRYENAVADDRVRGLIAQQRKAMLDLDIARKDGDKTRADTAAKTLADISTQLEKAKYDRYVKQEELKTHRMTAQAQMLAAQNRGAVGGLAALKGIYAKAKQEVETSLKAGGSESVPYLVLSQTNPAAAEQKKRQMIMENYVSQAIGNGYDPEEARQLADRIVAAQNQSSGAAPGGAKTDPLGIR